MQTVQEYLDNPPVEGYPEATDGYVVTTIENDQGGFVFNSVNNEGMLVQYYSFEDIAQFNDYPILQEANLALVGADNAFGTTKIVMPTDVGQTFGCL